MAEEKSKAKDTKEKDTKEKETEEMQLPLTLLEKLAYVQNNTEVLKTQWNDFSKYAYRNCEDILKATKPVLALVNCSITLNDEIVLIGERFYVKATAKFCDNQTGNSISTQAFAREEDTKRGMDGSQITGASSSYARKYALGGLLAIDDGVDPDIMDNRKNAKKDKPAQNFSLDFKAVRAKVNSATTVEDLEKIWITDVRAACGDNAKMVENAEKYLKPAFSKRKNEILGGEQK